MAATHGSRIIEALEGDVVGDPRAAPGDPAAVAITGAGSNPKGTAKGYQLRGHHCPSDGSPPGAGRAAASCSCRRAPAANGGRAVLERCSTRRRTRSPVPGASRHLGLGYPLLKKCGSSPWSWLGLRGETVREGHRLVHLHPPDETAVDYARPQGDRTARLPGVTVIGLARGDAPGPRPGSTASARTAARASPGSAPAGTLPPCAGAACRAAQVILIARTPRSWAQLFRERVDELARSRAPGLARPRGPPPHRVLRSALPWLLLGRQPSPCPFLPEPDNQPSLWGRARLRPTRAQPIAHPRGASFIVLAPSRNIPQRV